MQLGSTHSFSVPEMNIDASDFSWRNLWDTVNPLEHIPFVSTLYDAMTGEKPSAGAQLAGGALYGGPVGLVLSAINLAFQTETGHDAVGSVLAALDQDTHEEVANADAAQKPSAISPLESSPAFEIAPPIEEIEQAPLETKPQALNLAPSIDGLASKQAALRVAASYQHAQAHEEWQPTPFLLTA